MSKMQASTGKKKMMNMSDEKMMILSNESIDNNRFKFDHSNSKSKLHAGVSYSSPRSRHEQTYQEQSQKMSNTNDSTSYCILNNNHVIVLNQDHDNARDYIDK